MACKTDGCDRNVFLNTLYARRVYRISMCFLQFIISVVFSPTVRARPMFSVKKGKLKKKKLQQKLHSSRCTQVARRYTVLVDGRERTDRMRCQDGRGSISAASPRKIKKVLIIFFQFFFFISFTNIHTQTYMYIYMYVHSLTSMRTSTYTLS